MARFPTNADRVDPYENFRFRVKWDGRYVAGVSKVAALSRTVETVGRRGGVDPVGTKTSPGLSGYDAITLERGVTHDIGFERWANKVWDDTSCGSRETKASLADFRKDIVIERYDDAGRKVAAYNVHRCWPSEYTAMPELDAQANAVVIQSLKLENEGWERIAFA